MAGLYIHIPFCKQRCKYCAFYSTTHHALQEQYTHALCSELRARKHYIKGETIETIYFGGGTPSLLTEEQLCHIVSTIEKEYSVSHSAERTIECNPDDLTTAHLTMLRNCGFNRISIGIQSFSDTQLQTLGRRHTSKAAREAVKNAREAGFNNISIDLMFALPSSTLQEWKQSLQEAIALKPEHISAYNLTYEEGTPLYRALERGDIEEISEEGNIEQFNALIEELKKAGYRHYEISNFARPGFESRHNSSYWNDTPYLGCGAGAHSYDGNARGWNICDINKYIKGIENGDLPFEVEELTNEERYNDAVLTRLRTADGLPVSWIEEKFGTTLYNYMIKAAEPHIARGSLYLHNGRLSLTPEGVFISDAVIRDLIYV